MLFEVAPTDAQTYAAAWYRGTTEVF